MKFCQYKHGSRRRKLLSRITDIGLVYDHITFTRLPTHCKRRELKFAVEQYWRGDMPDEHLESIGRQLRREQWKPLS